MSLRLWAALGRLLRVGFALVLAALVLLGATSRAQADDRFFSSNPGPLAKEHASLDNDSGCNDCHVNDSKAIDSNKCLDCHDHNDLRSRIRAGEGFHASSQVKGKPCETCHVDHRGRGEDIRGWATIKGGEKSFDHKLGGWELKDKHAVLDCKDCHKKTNSAKRRTYLGEDKLCGTCHKRDQPHGFDRKALLACERCHTEVSWKPQKSRMDFDHNTKSDAEFPQEGAHLDVACLKCHPKAQFNLKQAKPGNCGNSGCHASPHEKMLFDKKSCDWCHSPKNRSLKAFEFNHAARTRFDLAGAHGKLDCYKCHTKELAFKKPNRSCATCHASDNPHRERFKEFGKPPACETCHPESSWKPNRFDHGRKTEFKLTGKHAQTECRQCHPGKKPFDFLDVSKDTKNGQACMGCHQHKNVHNGEFTDKPKSEKVMRDGKLVQTCLDCHKMAGVKRIGKEGTAGIHDEDGTWPLTNEHKKVKCVKCHVNDEYTDTPKQCGVRCHEDKLHKGTLGDECDRCHDPGQWPAVRFDHTDDTEWPLLGLHNRVPECKDCHGEERKFDGTPTKCAAEGCHAQDDAHKGKLGDGCERCHLETGENIFDHNLQSDYPLTGKHLRVKCADCHPSITFKPRPKDCFGGGACHPEPEVHKGQFGTQCEQCHTTDSFADIKALHDVGDFALKGAHDQQSCDRCHVDNRRLQGAGNLCINCHRQDDVHFNSLSPRCGTCHNQWAFTPAQFNHMRVGCNLTGIHRTAACFDCHQEGNFGGLSPTCYGCHKADIPLNSPTPHENFVNCSGCHNPNAWQNVIGSGRESVCR